MVSQRLNAMTTSLASQANDGCYHRLAIKRMQGLDMAAACARCLGSVIGAISWMVVFVARLKCTEIKKAPKPFLIWGPTHANA
jgi:hypothetical protein